MASLARPGGNITGFTQFDYSIAAKWLALLKEIAPNTTRAAVLRDPSITAGIEVTPISLVDAGEMESALTAFAHTPNSGLIVTASALTIARRDLIIARARRYRLPAVYPWRFFVTDGGLMSYGINDVELLRDAASYVDHILRGKKAAELPVQAPTKFQTVVNLKTAKTIGLDVPASLLVRADEVIE